ncbi:MAG: inositol monophosphatase [Candidatus Aerophobetes bacterium]|nr:inositol monophosphatase [Candidatus Aerophobetes bacterium]
MKIALEAAEEAGEILLKNFGKIKEISLKRDASLVSLVTNVDLESEEKITQIIRNSFPEHDILSEERIKINNHSPYKWIIDPLDGTHNYIRGIPFFGICIALASRGEVVMSVVNLPYFNQMFTAEKGKGAYSNGEGIKVSGRSLNEVTMVYDSTFSLDKKNMLDQLDKLTGKVFNLRMFGSSAQNLSLLAKGSVDLYIEHSDKPWDFAAGALIVEEAGGRVTDFNGNKWTLDPGKYIASNRKIHEEVLRILKED